MNTCSRCKDCERCDGCEIEPCEIKSSVCKINVLDCDVIMELWCDLKFHCPRRILE